MSPSNITNKLWNYCNVLRDDGMSYGDYVEQLTYLLFLKMADERTQAPYHQPSIVPQQYSWSSLIKKDGDELFDHYRHALDALGKEKGLLGLIFNKAQNKFQDPAKLRRLLVDLIDKENWSVMSADVKGDAYEGLLEKNAQDTKSGAGQYFTPRALIQAMVDAMAPEPGETIADPACGTGGFLLAAHRYLVDNYPNMTKPQKKALKAETFKGWELVQSTARLCAMNMLLHGIGDQEYEPIVVGDSLAADPGEVRNLVEYAGELSDQELAEAREALGEADAENLGRRQVGHPAPLVVGLAEAHALYLDFLQVFAVSNNARRRGQEPECHALGARIANLVGRGRHLAGRQFFHHDPSALTAIGDGRRRPLEFGLRAACFTSIFLNGFHDIAPIQQSCC